MRLYVANVGVNTADANKRRMRSPVFRDGSFEFVPIREESRFSGAEQIPTYNDLPSSKARMSSLADYLPDDVGHYRAHADPEFETSTYGDIPVPRAANLAYMIPGDQLWFLARLWNHDGTCWTGGHDFYFIGFIQVERNDFFEAGTRPDEIPSELRERIRNNAHYRRLLAGDRRAFRILCGKRQESRRFDRALKVTAAVAGLLFGGSYDETSDEFWSDGKVVRNKNGNPRLFRHFGSITRAIQYFRDSRDPEQWRCIEELMRLATSC